MSSSTRKHDELVAGLSQKERARLALKLIESLDPGTDEDAEELWLDEAERRLSEYDAGKLKSRPVSDVVAEIKSRIE
jgi:putative addiction module component (TIGR02574 family)